MKVLITNDDGFEAKGINALYERFIKSDEIEEIYVFAPEKEQSCSGTSLTLHKPLRVKEVKQNFFRLNGSPADCIAIALEEFCKDGVDIVISGINHGPNLGTDVIYSGTVSAAVQATLMGVPAIAVSLSRLESPPEEWDFSAAVDVAFEWAKKVVKNGLPRSTYLNINVPNGKGIKRVEDLNGTAVTRMAFRKYSYKIEKRKDPYSRDYFWHGGRPIGHDEKEGTDCTYAERGYVTVTPIRLDFTDIEFLEELSTWL